MAEGVRAIAKSTIGIGITGIAGPTGGSPAKPVGLVYIAIAVGGQATQVTRHDFGGDRSEITARAASIALALTRSTLLK